jgi:hypothetical protein
MRAKEFTINIPINIKINDDGNPEIDMGNGNQGVSDDDFDQNPVFTPPLQQQIELQKHELGKTSPTVTKLLQPDPELGDEQPDGVPEVGDQNKERDPLIDRIKELIAR